ncbi:hypothetical protein [Kordia sp.]|uniref:hypothetical protein n=1 Tax=Kordia sp. TaxID=1965332 RepID=UPI003B59AB70
MKKRNLKSLRLNKKSISDLTPNRIHGGNDLPFSWQKCSQVMSCITYTQENNTCNTCTTYARSCTKLLCEPTME